MHTAMTMNINERTKQYMQAISTSLERYLADAQLPQQSVVDAMRYSLLSGGKRIRAILCLEFCRMCGGTVSDALPFACAVEMIHCYSLIHDDLPCMDNDDLRRGQPACHIAFGEATALLAGDALLTLAFDVMLNNPSNEASAKSTVRAAGILAQAAGYRGMIGGQVVDLASEGTELDEQALTLIHRMKTAALIRAAAAIGCVVAGGTEQMLSAADRYCEKIGLSFQIVDDILDIIGTSEQLGKPVGSDRQNSKFTFAALHGVAKATELVHSLADQAKQQLAVFPYTDEYIYQFTDQLADRTQ